MTIYELAKILRGEVDIVTKEWGVVCPEGHDEICEGCKYFANDVCNKTREVITTSQYAGPAAGIPISIAGLPVSYITHNEDSILVIVRSKNG